MLPSPVAWGALFSSSSENQVSCLRDRDNDSVIRVMGKSMWNQAWETDSVWHILRLQCTLYGSMGGPRPHVSGAFHNKKGPLITVLANV